MRGRILYALLGAAVATAAMLALRRPGGTPLVSVLPPSEAEVAWERPIPEVWLDDVSTEQAVVTLCRQAGVPVRWDKKALEAADVDLSTPVTLHHRGWMLGDLLQEGVFKADERRDSDKCASALPDRDAILITSAAAAANRRVIRSYDVADLLPAKNAPVTVPVRFDFPISPPMKTTQYPIELLKSLIEDTVAVETWRRNGGTGGAIHPLGHQLVIVQSHDAQRQIRRLLQFLRERPPPPPTGPAPALLDWHEGLGRWVPHDADIEEMAMSARIDHLRLDRVPFGDAIESLGRSAGVKLVLRREALQAAGVPLDVPVTLELKAVSLADALDVMLQFPPARSSVGYTPEGGVVKVSTREETDKVTYTRIYNMGDWHPAQASLAKWWLGDFVRSSDADRAYEALFRAITDSVDPDSWKDNGGTAGSLKEMGGILVVEQTWENHRRVRALLTALRAGRALPATQPAAADGVATRPAGVGDASKVGQ